MVDQEKVTRVDFSLYAVRNICIVSRKINHYGSDLYKVLECGTEYFIFNGKGGRLQFGVTPF